ncbi:membrane protein [Streptomyces sp. SPB074]|uniref:membrane protein n=1 Tax=Streptomyces sp. (strain SPB074) TaxID=465543 RepID=UPI00017FEDE7|nr:membrane protein [Streptomyces sp. SPB074]EDY45858.1 membrane protein [Streptomyces sp. SPB074]
MTTRTEPTEHPAPEELADLSEDLLSSGRSAELRGHLTDCPDCAEIYASLAEIRTLLGALPAPPPLPADVRARIDAALREAAEETDVSRETCASAETEIAPDVSRETSRTASPSEAHVSRGTSAVPARPSSRDVSRETSTRRTRPAPSRPAPAGPGRTSTRWGSRRRLFWGGTATVLALGAGSLLLSSLGSGKDEQTPSAQQSQQSPVFSGSPLKMEVNALLQDAGDSGSTAGNSPKSADSAPAGTRQPPLKTGAETPLLADTPGVPGCVKRGIGREDTALGVERGTYRGRDAYLVVLPHARDTARVTAYIVDAACVGLRSAAKGEVLHSSSFPR